jgi:hypothetical protein
MSSVVALDDWRGRTRSRALTAVPDPRPSRMDGRAGRAGGEAALRITPRGWVVLRVGLGVLVVLVAIGSLLLAGQSAEAGSEVGRSPVVQRIVLPGETLWQIAGEVAPDVDRRETIATILELNSLDSAGVSAGQRITVPVASGSGRG